MPFLATMPMTMIRPMKTGDVEGGSSDQQRADHARNGEHRGGENGDRRGEIAELGQQNTEDQHQRQDEHTREFSKRFLLLLVGAAVLDANTGGQMHGLDTLAHRA